MYVTAYETTASTPPGWFPDPGQTGSLRWWDGTAWTDHLAPAWQPPGAWSGPAQPSHDLDYVLPVNRDGFAIAAGYLGLFSLLPNPLTSTLAIACGWIALKRMPTTGKLGRGRAWFGIIVGGLSLGVFALAMLTSLSSS
jgi:hypothetical protein